ncbi:MAG: hypothetical protein IJ334_12040, partial [Clostridia bacterium]|nr:hypothetical protein [Clostridia bacterium]
TLSRGQRASGTAYHKLNRRFEVLSWDVFTLSELDGFKVEEQIASARFTAKKPDGSTALITNLSNTYKQDFFMVTRYLTELKKDGKLTPDEKGGKKKDEQFCPKCGSKYIDPQRKICPKCMDKNKIIRRTAQFIFKYKIQIVILIAMLILTSAMGILAPYISSGFYYDEVLNTAGKFYGEIVLVLTIIISTRIFSLLISMVHNIVTSIIAARLVYDLKKVIFGSIERLSLSFFTNRQTGGLMTQVTRDANTIYWFFCDGVPYYLVNVVQVAVVLVIMLIMNPILTLLAVVTVPFLIVSMRWIFDRMGKYHAKRWTRSRQMNSVLSDVLSGMRVVKAFSKEKDETKRFDTSSRNLAEIEMQTSTFNTVAFPTIHMLF